MPTRYAISLTALFTGLLLSIAAPAQAASTCRQAARDLTATVSKTTNINDFQAAVNDAHDAHPDCLSEFTTLATWYDGGGKGPYPFRAEDDPAKGFLGPVGWWWNLIYVSLFGRNVLLMFLFGWELFLMPIIFVLSVCGALLAGVGNLFRRGPRPV